MSTHTHMMIFRAHLYVCFSRKSPSDVTSVIDAGEVTFPRSSASARVCEERLVVHLSRRSTGFDTPWLVTELSSRTQRVLTYIIYTRLIPVLASVSVCVCAMAMAVAAAVIVAAADGSHKVSRKTIHYCIVGSTHNIT